MENHTSPETNGGLEKSSENNGLSQAYDLCVFIGRFQPFHRAHQGVVEAGLRQAGRVLVLVGSANEPRTLRNPFTAEERMAMIQGAFSGDPRVAVAALEDSTYDTAEWVERTYATVEAAWDTIRRNDPLAPTKPRVALIGHAKDATSFYLDLFPRWGEIRVAPHTELAATALRAELFGSYGLTSELLQAFFPQERITAHADDSVRKVLRQIANTTSPAFLAAYTDRAREHALAFLGTSQAQSQLPSAVISRLVDFLGTSAYETLAFEQAFVFKGKYAWRLAPYEPIFMTADAVLFRGNQVLMVKRGNYPGKGLWALPGGFLEPNETLEAAALRELEEETSLNVTAAQLKAALFGSELIDAPFRSSRGRTVTMAFFFSLDEQTSAETKEGGLEGDEETQDIAWRDVETLRRDEVFEDHYNIIAKAKRCLANTQN